MRNLSGGHGSTSLFGFICKRYLVCLLGLFATLLLQACSGGGGGSDDEPSAPPVRQPQVVLQVIEPSGAQRAVDTLYLGESGTQVLRKIADLGEHFSTRRFAVSPGGRYLAYWSLDGANAPNIYSFWLSNVDGGSRRQVHFSSFEPEYHWSPDGESLLYVGYEGINQIALLINLVDGTQTLLTNPGQLLTQFAWSEDGAHVAYDLRPTWANHEVWVRDLKAATTKSVFNTTSESIKKILISHNGSHVVVVAEASGIDRLHIVNTANVQITTLDNVFLSDFDWLPGKNSAYYTDGATHTLYRMDLDIFSVSLVTYGGGNVMADEVFLSPDGSKLFFNSYGIPNNVVGVIRVLDGSVQYSQSLGLGAAYPFGVVAWDFSGEKVAVVYEDRVTVVDAIAGNETEIKKMDSTSLAGVSTIDWVNEADLALQINRDIYVGEQTKNNFRKIGVTNHYGLVEPAFDSMPEEGALFYLSVAPVNGIVAPPEFSGLGLPVFYDVQANRYDVLRLQSGEVPSVSYFQVVK